MSDGNNTAYWQNLKGDFMDYIKRGHDSPRYFNEFARSMDLLIDYARANDHAEYSPELGFAFFKYEEENPRYKGPSTLERRRKTIRRLNTYLYGDSFWQRPPRNLSMYRKHAQQPQCPEQFSEVFERFMRRITKDGLKESTVEDYRRSCTLMLLDFVQHGVNEWGDINTRTLTSAFLRATNKEHFVAKARRLFRFLVSEGILDTDYTGVLVRSFRQKKIPSVYTEAEVQQLLGCVEIITPQGKRDYAILLMAVRLGLRASDIRNLCFDNVDFEKGEINFVQQKTDVPHQLSLPEEVIVALRDYIDNGREDSDEPNIFLDGHKRPLSKTCVSNIAQRRFKKSNINPGNRSHGSHALRMTFASQLIAEDVPYDVVRALLGQVDPESTRHYVVHSIESLRLCALEVPPPSGRLEQYLAGGAV